MYSSINQEALKALKTYTNNDTWHCYWHGLSGDELTTQVFTVAHKPSDKMLSFSFSDLANPYKISEEQGIRNYLKEKFKVGADEVLPYVFEFLNDAKIEYTNKPFIKEIT